MRRQKSDGGIENSGANSRDYECGDTSELRFVLVNELRRFS